MRYSVEHKQETRARILDAASRLFRQEGYGGSGIGPLTKAAGVTNGAFYGHFKSKGEAFRSVVLAGLDQLRQGVATFKAEHGARWRRPFVSFYLGPRRTCALGESCALPSLSPEVMRADDDTRDAYEQALRQIVDEVSSGLGDAPDDDRAIAFLALLSGGVTLARAVRDPLLAERIADAVGRYAVVIAERTDVRPEQQA
ncbi:TetR family transcriptional regulator [Burkholderia diffusa]|uniref:TetR/AcrR family transcriptional regulator n=1 Tax=Burkholderia diffusa TaxID=488732 RepID=UPI00075B6A70|nr:TetR/AcrR family transcriptional regulator [Burkholderia diffusa]KUZ09175.1 TetR family transcriptional regulator [Burkholderia diffusa]KVC15002.1 TetR family transcriptional regulator [Burkholderia diffusa]KVC48814.1 TetR family transcriptional regulator [Burkholderia diffusa]KVH51132.1 TetR family transcriptional regulator [Burkholderia diffusa]KWF85726.1 TetR family transcriptional regulator [Burkholderia diffusa]